MESSREMTAARIIEAALDLMKDRGFKAVTLREIAYASEVSEMTVIRHFQTKKGVLEAAVKKSSHLVGTHFKSIFESELEWELEQDLQRIAFAYLGMMEMNQAVCLIAVQERATMPELVRVVADNTGRLKQFLVRYYEEMRRRGKLGNVQAEVQTTAFFTTLFGYFLSTSMWGDQFIKESKEQFVKAYVETCCKGMLPASGSNPA